MEILATAASVALVVLIAWQLLGSIFNIVGIIVGLFKG